MPLARCARSSILWGKCAGLWHVCGSAQLARVASSISPEEHAKNSLTANRDLFVRVLRAMAFELQLGESSNASHPGSPSWWFLPIRSPA